MMGIKLLFKRALAASMSLALIAAMSPVGFAELAYAAEEETGDFSSEDATGVISYSEENVALLAQVDFDVECAEDGGVQVTVPLDEWSSAAVATSRPYVAFADSGERTDSSDPRLGVVDITADVHTCVIKRVSALASDNEVVFTGANGAASAAAVDYVGCRADCGVA